MAFGKKLNLIPTASLLRAVQDPRYAVSIDVPGFAALDELQQRKIKGENLKLAMAQAPQQTVKDQTVASFQPGLPRPQAVASAPTEMPQQPVQPAAPQQEMPVDQDRAMPTMMAAEGGIIDLPTQYNPIPEATYARGGIVAFAAGGVPEFQLPAAPSYDMTLYNEMLAANPRRTLEEVEAEEEKRRQARGIDIKGMYERQVKGLQEEKEAIKKAYETNKALAGIEWAGEMLKSTSPFFGPGIGAGAVAAAKTLGTGEREMQSANRQLRREENAMDVAKTNMDMAMMKGDRDEYNQQLNRYQTAAAAKQAIQNKMEETRYAGELEKAKEEYKYLTQKDIAEIQAAASKNTDFKFTVNNVYKKLVASGMPANDETMALATEYGASIMGRVTGASKLGLEQQGLYANVVKNMNSEVNQRLKNDQVLVGLKSKLEMANYAQDAKEAKKVEAQIKARENEIKGEITSDYQTKFPAAFGAEPSGDNFKLPSVETKVKDKGPGKNTDKETPKGKDIYGNDIEYRNGQWVYPTPPKKK